jgi:hypothetical protein
MNTAGTAVLVACTVTATAAVVIGLGVVIGLSSWSLL